MRALTMRSSIMASLAFLQNIWSVDTGEASMLPFLSP